MDHWKLIKKKLKGTLNENQRRQFESWLKEDQANVELFQQIEANWNASYTDEFKVKPAFKKLKKRITKGELDSLQKTKTIRWAVAASFALIVGVSLVFFLSRPGPETNYLTKSTGIGQKATITLSDGSSVRLNSESSITYPESFAEVATRDIKLTGEAFFEVKRDEAKPFTIQTQGLLTTVLGTSFNITAFPDIDEIEVTVATGKVSVTPIRSNSPLQGDSTFRGKGGSSPNNEAQKIFLTPGQQATFHKSSRELSMREVDIEDYLTWKDGTLLFNGDSFLEVISELERWYGVDFEIIGSSDGCQIVGKYKNESLENILNGLSQTLNLKMLNGINNEKIILEVAPCK